MRRDIEKEKVQDDEDDEVGYFNIDFCGPDPDDWKIVKSTQNEVTK